jgi:hypothetical protein
MNWQVGNDMGFDFDKEEFFKAIALESMFLKFK